MAAAVAVMPYVFTEHGALMRASVLNSEKAIQASIQIVRAFVRLRELLATHQELARKLAEMEKKYNAEFKAIFEAFSNSRNRRKSRNASPSDLLPSDLDFSLLCLAVWRLFAFTAHRCRSMMQKKTAFSTSTQ